MPVFHTKIIESILEPVAQQVSKLVILHEEAEDGNAMPDLARPVQAVKLAVENLVKVGYETIQNSEDQILKQDMPPALTRVEEASILLLEASDMLRADPYSAPARKKLIEGSRGILQGTSALLLAFDESEVRKIIRICKNVLEYLAITEVIDSMEDLVTFVKNISPVLTRMTKDVDAREKELTHQVHREWLLRSLEQVKQLTPVLISSVKIYVSTKASGAQDRSVTDAQNNRDFMVQKLSSEIHEIIRVLQLTTYDEDEWDADDVTVMKKAQSAFDGKMKQAIDWLLDPSSYPGSTGERYLRQMLSDAMQIANCATNPEDKEAIKKAVSDIQAMTDALTELKAQGKGSSPQAISLARGIQQKLHDLAIRCQQAIANTERSDQQKPAHTLAGKVEQAQRWLANPAISDKGLGEKALQEIVSEARRIADGLQGPRRDDLLQTCDEIESLSHQLSELNRRGMGNSPQARAIAANLSHKLHQLNLKVQDALVKQVADDFIDITTPLKQLSDAAQAPPGTPHREANFEDRAKNFVAVTQKQIETARLLADNGGCNNKHIIENIHSFARQVDGLTPQVINAARIVLNSPGNPTTLEHFELLKKQWTDSIEHLRALVDDATDTVAFLKASEEGILRDTEHTELAIRTVDPNGIVLNTSSIARRANRVLQVAQQEVDNSEDPRFVDHVNATIRELRATITPMVQNAKALAQNPRDNNAAGRWRGCNQELIDAVGNMRRAMQPPDVPPPPPAPDMSGLHISVPASSVPAAAAPSPAARSLAASPFTPISPAVSRASVAAFGDGYYSPDMPYPPPPPPPMSAYNPYEDHAPPRPSLPRDSAPPRPPPPDTDDEDEAYFPLPQANQPIMMAAHALHMDVKQWSSRDNDIIAAAKRMAILMAQLSQLVRGEGGSKKDLIDVAKAIAEASEEVARLAKELAKECTDKRMRLTLLQVCERIPTIGTQLKILSTVKATMLGAQGSDEDQEATEMLVGNAQNLMQSVRETVRAAQAATIKIRVDSGISIRWVRKRPWYT